MRRFVYTTQVSEGHVSNTGDVFLCQASENEKKMAAFSEKFKILYKFSYSVNFGVPPVHCEWGKKNNATFCVTPVHIISMNKSRMHAVSSVYMYT